MYHLLQLCFLGNSDEDYIETAKLKTILRNIIKLLMVVTFFDMMTLLFYIVTSGGHIIRLLMKIPYIYDFDHSHRFAYCSLGITIIISTVISSTGYILFRGNIIKQINDPNIEMMTKIHRISELFVMILGLIFLCLVPIMFIYTMMLFRFAIQQLMDTYAIANKLDETNMVKLKTKLSDLNDQYKEIIPWFSVPLTVTLSSSVFITISSACFLMINNSTNANLYISFVLNLGIFSFIRLIIVASFGNLPTNICRDLIRTVYENLEHWSLHEWMCFMELKRLRKEFIVSIFSMYTVRQSSILAMLGFVLNYIVILLQTENFSTGNNDNVDSSSSSSSNNISKNNFHQ
ncbi:hypothetical protein HUG17_3889 [Dermatophagoides farinae]|uniref:Uncharacterized protein n=1 Tax=Dermatophagoides farinae TaxID=6954 RepID=A0A9D4NWZ2_DERFA|nr:hypothetical protein HUG17_3889 [Dermatophagoides farinae]